MKRGFLSPTVINEAQVLLNEDEYDLLKLGPRFIYNDPQAASRRRANELATLKRKIEKNFYHMKVSPGRIVEQFISKLDLILQNLHKPSAINQLKNTSSNNKQKPTVSYDNLLNDINSNESHMINLSSMYKNKKMKNYNRIVKRLKYKLHLSNTILQKTDKSKVFHLGKYQDYQRKSEEYMDKTAAYNCLDVNNPLQDLIERTNKYLLNLRLNHWINQKQYEQLSVNPNEVKLAHLYYLPKAHKPGTPLRPIIAGIKHATIKISKYLDNLLRPLFNQMAYSTSVASGTEVLGHLNNWSKKKKDNLNRDTLLCTIDVTDLYTIIPQAEGVLSIKKMLNFLRINELGGLKIEAIIRLARFVMKNNYFSYNKKFYHQTRGGAMGSPLTLTIANCYMFFFERNIYKQISNSGGMYLRYIDDILIIINWPVRHLIRQIESWNKSDPNIKLNAQHANTVNFLDLHIENKTGEFMTQVYHKPSYEPYYLPFNSVHPMHMKRNIPFEMLCRAIKYCSTFETFIYERTKLKMALLLNKYPSNFIDKQFHRALQKLNISQPLNRNNYTTLRENSINVPVESKVSIDYIQTMFIHFTYCLNMRTFPEKFHLLWNDYFKESPLNEIKPVLGNRNANNLQQRLVNNKCCYN